MRLAVALLQVGCGLSYEPLFYPIDPSSARVETHKGSLRPNSADAQSRARAFILKSSQSHKRDIGIPTIVGNGRNLSEEFRNIDAAKK